MSSIKRAAGLVGEFLQQPSFSDFETCNLAWNSEIHLPLMGLMAFATRPGFQQPEPPK